MLGLTKSCPNEIISYTNRYSIFLVCSNCLDKVPTLKSINHAWITNYIKQFTCRKQHSYNHDHLIKLSEDWSKYYYLKKQCQCHCQCRLAFNNYLYTLTDPDSSEIIKRLYLYDHINYIKSWKQDGTGVDPLTHRGTTITDPIAKANVLLFIYFYSGRHILYT